MPTRIGISSILVSGARATGCAALLAMGFMTPAAAQGASWIVEPSAAMTRTVDNVTLVYKRASGENDTLRISVANCGDGGWSMEDGINTVTADSLREDIAEEFENARLNCTLA